MPVSEWAGSDGPGFIKIKSVFLLTLILFMLYSILLKLLERSSALDLNQIPQWLLALEPEDIAFLKNFVLKSGSLKEIARLYGVSYPTVRLRLDKLIQKIELSDQQKEEPFSAFIKGLAVDGRVDLDTAKLIIDRYQREKEVDA